MGTWSYNFVTLNKSIIARRKDSAYAKGQLSRLLHHIGIEAKMVNKGVTIADLLNALGEAGETNVQGGSEKPGYVC